MILFMHKWLSCPIWNPAAAKSLQSCPTLCDPRDGSPPGSPVPGALQARTLEWVAISLSNAWKWKVKVKSLIMSDSSKPHGLQPTRLLHPWDFPGKSPGVGCHRLLRFGLQFHFIAPHYMWMSSSFHLCSSSLSRIAHNVEILTPASSAHLEPITSWWNGLPVGGTLTWLDNNSLAKQSSHTDALFNLLGLTQPVKR